MKNFTFNYDFIGKMWIFMTVSIIAVLGSLTLMATKGLNFGTDFKEGTKLQYHFSAPTSDGELRKLLEGLNLGDFSVQKMGASSESKESRFAIKIELQEEGVSKKITETFQKGLKDNTATLEQEESVGPKAGADMRRKAYLANIFSWILMLIYIGYRFEFAFGPGAIIALIHDALITLGAFAITQREVSLTVVAALLTITGYSVNDTIVIFDRIRENVLKMPKSSDEEIVNKSVNETLSRTIITNFTVFIVVILIFVFGEGEFKNFGFAMIVGAISGTYSTIYVASPCYILYKKYVPKLLASFGKA